jgi:uncharacterized protein YpmB
MKKYVLMFIIVVLLLIWQSIYTYQRAVEYQNQQHNSAIRIAKEIDEIVEVKRVTTYNGKQSYSVVYGIREDNTERIICVPNQKDNQIITIDPAEGITEEEAVEIVIADRNPAEIKSVTIGIEQNVPIWEVIYLDEQNRYSYYYITFKDGQFIKRYTL